MTSAAAAIRARARADVIRHAQHCSDLADLARHVRRDVAKAVPFDVACLTALDPATLLPTACAAEPRMSAATSLLVHEHEARSADVDARSVHARRERPTEAPSVVTDGGHDRRRLHRALRRPEDFGDELHVVLTDASGTWGALTLLRDADGNRFTEHDAEFVASLAGPLAGGVRRTTLLADAGEASRSVDDAVGLLVLDPEDGIESANRAAELWLDALGADGPRNLPIVVRAVAAQARRVAASDETLARARVLTTCGRWAVVRGSLLGEGHGARVAVVVESARPAELAPLIADAYGLTDQERRITELVARGCTTNEIAAQLHLSAYTVQDHLKAVFERTGVNSRGELVARLFFDRHAPRLASRPDRLTTSAETS